MKKLLLVLLLLIPINIKAWSAESYIVMDQDSDKIFQAKNIHKIKSVASISKIMTAILVIENIDIEKEVIVKDEIDSAYGSAVYIKKGEKLKIKDLLYGLMLRSGNDAAVSLAVNTFSSVDEFVNQMNKLAKKIGMKNTVFNNPSGLDEEKGNYSTAYDMALLTSYAMKNKTYQKIVKTEKYKVTTNYMTYIWYNKNKLLKYDYITGGKTGYTLKAKRTLVSTASKNGLNLVTVTLNDGNDFVNHKKSYDDIFSNYINYVILKKGTISILGEKKYSAYDFYIKNDVKYGLNKSELNSLIVHFKIFENIKDVEKEVGTIEVKIDDEIVKTEKLYMNKKNNKVSLFDKIKKWFK